MGEKVSVRFMTVEDIDGVLEVEQDSFTLPWSRAAFESELTSNQFAHYLVADCEEEIVGYCGVWVVIDDAHITNIAVHSNHRGKSIGELLLANALEMAKSYGALRMSLEVRVTNHVAQSLYKKYGFQPGGIRKNYYTDNLEDALVMWVNLHEQSINEK
ncbi:ribosomal protein S18-alanine N-acetyltransferase [Thalassobacillus sp. C254]|uniref:ribosomal protein S18-alanine N-acetyltransferase n=1 Tax=Thalassobacillus sp. C254 TaxID=1225341 RepID=UPI0006D03BD3|nr:ribosomal protein S18-alanine N-acetyltransferase [Thalassobacillus sp. C254]